MQERWPVLGARPQRPSTRGGDYPGSAPLASQLPVTVTLTTAHPSGLRRKQGGLRVPHTPGSSEHRGPCFHPLCSRPHLGYRAKGSDAERRPSDQEDQFADAEDRRWTPELIPRRDMPWSSQKALLSSALPCGSVFTTTKPPRFRAPPPAPQHSSRSIPWRPTPGGLTEVGAQPANWVSLTKRFSYKGANA